VCWFLAHRTVSGAPGPYRLEPATLEKLEARSAIIHRTVRCVTRLSGEPAKQWLPVHQRLSAKATVHNSATTEVIAQKLEGTRLSGVAPECPMQQDDKAPQRSTALNPNSCADVARTGQCTVTVRWRTGLCVAPIASRIQPTARSGWEYINTPNHLIHSHLSLLKSSFIARAKAQHSKTQSKQSIHSKSPNQL
jgi:hypothetical protein